MLKFTWVTWTSKVSWKKHDQLEVLRLLPDRLLCYLVVEVGFALRGLVLRPHPGGHYLGLSLPRHAREMG